MQFIICSQGKAGKKKTLMKTVFMHAKDRSVREAEQVATAAELNMAMKPYSFLYIRSKKNERLCLEPQSSKSILMGKM